MRLSNLCKLRPCQPSSSRLPCSAGDARPPCLQLQHHSRPRRDVPHLPADRLGRHGSLPRSLKEEGHVAPPSPCDVARRDGTSPPPWSSTSSCFLDRRLSEHVRREHGLSPPSSLHLSFAAASEAVCPGLHHGHLGCHNTPPVERNGERSVCFPALCHPRLCLFHRNRRDLFVPVGECLA